MPKRDLLFLRELGFYQIFCQKQGPSFSVGLIMSIFYQSTAVKYCSETIDLNASNSIRNNVRDLHIVWGLSLILGYCHDDAPAKCRHFAVMPSHSYMRQMIPYRRYTTCKTRFRDYRTFFPSKLTPERIKRQVGNVWLLTLDHFQWSAY